MTREPLLHFLVIGGLLFALHGLAAKGSNGRSEEIVVDSGRIAHMTGTFAQTWQRVPTEEELKGLIDQYVREEAMSREAVKMGLDRDDVIIRRQLQQKIEFVADDLGNIATPTEADLAGYLESHQDRFRRDATFSFRHVYLSPDRRGDDLERDAARLLADLSAAGAGIDESRLGDPSLFEPAFQDLPRSGIEAVFGPGFAADVAALPVGRWCGPIASAYGVHLVFISGRTEGRLPELDEVRADLLREWENERRTEARRRFLENVMKQYEVRIDWPESEPGFVAG